MGIFDPAHRNQIPEKIGMNAPTFLQGVQPQGGNMNPFYAMSMMQNPFNPVNFMQPRLSPLASQLQRLPMYNPQFQTYGAGQQALNKLYEAQTERQVANELYAPEGLYGSRGALSNLYGSQGDALGGQTANQSALINSLFGNQGLLGGGGALAGFLGSLNNFLPGMFLEGGGERRGRQFPQRPRFERGATTGAFT